VSVRPVFGRLAFAVWVIVALLGAGCGFPTDVEPRALPAGGAPDGILEGKPATTTVTTPPGSSTQVAVFFFAPVPAGGVRLVPVQRLVQAPATVEKVVSVLFRGPTDEEIARGLRTATNPRATVVGAPVKLGIAAVDLAGNVAVGAGTEQVAMALAQIVYTATNLGGVVGLTFTIDGKKREVPQSDGTQTQAPVGRAAYAPKYGPL
jgi:spore germination protein GerM